MGQDGPLDNLEKFGILDASQTQPFDYSRTGLIMDAPHYELISSRSSLIYIIENVHIDQEIKYSYFSQGAFLYQ